MYETYEINEIYETPYYQCSIKASRTSDERKKRI